MHKKKHFAGASEMRFVEEIFKKTENIWYDTWQVSYQFPQNN